MSSRTSHLIVSRNQLNNSSSKQLFTFSKQPRFRSRTQTLSARSYSVSLPGVSSNHKKGISFSKSKKALIFQNELEERQHPPPNIYNTISTKVKRQGITMGRRIKTLSTIQFQKTPGPASYNSVRSESKLSFSFTKQQKKLKFPIENRKGEKTPGPYLIQANKLQKIISKYQSSKDIKIKAHGRDFHKYKMENKIKNHQQEVLQKFNTYKQKGSQSIYLGHINKRIVFNKAVKKSCFDVSTKEKRPGPQQYQRFTEFAEINKPVHQKSSKKLKSKGSLQKQKGKLNLKTMDNQEDGVIDKVN